VSSCEQHQAMDYSLWESKNQRPLPSLSSRPHPPDVLHNRCRPSFKAPHNHCQLYVGGMLLDEESRRCILCLIRVEVYEEMKYQFLNWVDFWLLCCVFLGLIGI
jgi:hypothetical protein